MFTSFKSFFHQQTEMIKFEIKRLLISHYTLNAQLYYLLIASNKRILIRPIECC